MIVSHFGVCMCVYNMPSTMVCLATTNAVKNFITISKIRIYRLRIVFHFNGLHSPQSIKMMFLSYTNNLISKHFQYHTRVIVVDSISFAFSFLTHLMSTTRPLTLFASHLLAHSMRMTCKVKITNITNGTHIIITRLHSRQAFYSWFEMNSASFYVPYRSNSTPPAPPTFPSISLHRHSHCRLLLVPSISHSISTVLGHFLA